MVDELSRNRRIGNQIQQEIDTLSRLQSGIENTTHWIPRYFSKWTSGSGDLLEKSIANQRKAEEILYPTRYTLDSGGIVSPEDLKQTSARLLLASRKAQSARELWWEYNSRSVTSAETWEAWLHGISKGIAGGFILSGIFGAFPRRGDFSSLFVQRQPWLCEGWARDLKGPRFLLVCFIGVMVMGFIHGIVAPPPREEKLPDNPELKNLILEAQEGIRKKNPALLKKIGRFLVRTEQAASTEFQTTEGKEAERSLWTGLGQFYWDLVGAQTDDWKEQLSALMDHNFENYFQIYVRNNALLREILKGFGGNCEASTKMTIAAFYEAGIQLPDGWVLGIQKFRDHMQPVIYNTKNGMIWDLMENRWTGEIRAPIFHVTILYHAFLKSQNRKGHLIDLVASEKELLIASPNILEEPPKTTPKDTTDSNLFFPQGYGYYNTGPTPEVAYLKNPYVKSKESNPLKQPGPVQKKGERDEKPAGIHALEDLSNEWREFYNHILTREYRILPYLIERDPELILFSNRLQRDHYLLLNSDQTRANFLMILAFNAISEFLDDSFWGNSIELLRDPSQIRRYNRARFEEVKGKLAKLFGAVSAVQRDLSSEQYTDLLQRLTAAYPRFKELLELKRQLENRIRREPDLILRQLGELTPEQRFLYLELIGAVGGTYLRPRWGLYYGSFSLSEAERDLERTALNSDLPPEVMTDLILYYGGAEGTTIVKKWNDDIQKTFSRLNEDRSYNDLFLASFRRWPDEMKTGGRMPSAIKTGFLLQDTEDYEQLYIVPKNVRRGFRTILTSILGKPIREGQLVYDQKLLQKHKKQYLVQ